METVEDVLEHFGIKGMKWGVRKSGPKKSLPQRLDESKFGTAAKANANRYNARQALKTQKKTDKADKKFVKKATSSKEYFKAYNEAADKMNSVHIDRINNKAAYKGKDFTADSPLRRKYYAEYSKTMETEMHSALKRNLGPSPSGKLKIDVSYNVETDFLPNVTVVRTDEAAHADESTTFAVKVSFDSNGMIKKFEIPDLPELSHVEEMDEFLEHFGIKGMKWGIRKDKAPRASVASEDAARAKASAKIVKRHGTKALSNKELQDLVTRMNLEQQFSTLSAKRMGAGEKFVRDVMTNVAKQQVTTLVNGVASQQLNKAMKAKK